MLILDMFDLYFKHYVRSPDGSWIQDRGSWKQGFRDGHTDDGARIQNRGSWNLDPDLSDQRSWNLVAEALQAR